MFNPRVVLFIASVLVLGPLAAPGLIMPVQAQEARGKVIPAERLTREQIRRLPDSQVVESRGKRITIGQLKAMRAAEAKAAAAQARAARSRAQARLKALQHKLLKEQQAKINAENAKVKAELARLRRKEAAFIKIRQEAIQLYNRAKTASPAEKAKIERRAETLLQQLSKTKKRPVLKERPVFKPKRK